MQKATKSRAATHSRPSGGGFARAMERVASLSLSRFVSSLSSFGWLGVRACVGSTVCECVRVKRDCHAPRQIVPALG